MLAFPSTPTVGQVYAPAAAGRAWEWDGSAWNLVSDDLDPRMVALIEDPNSATHAALVALIAAQP